MKDYHCCKKCTPRYGVVIPARDEADTIKATITALFHQTIQPSQIVLVDDCSTDGTGNIAKQLGIDVVRYPFEHESWVIHKNLAKVFNAGLDKIDRDLDYVMVLGADQILPINHMEYLINEMNKDENLVIVSGRIQGEHNTIPRGSGRIVDWQWWNSFEEDAGRYRVNFGYESWLIGKCHAMNKKCAVFDEIISTVSRPTSTNYKDEKYLHRGQAYQALGYIRRFVLCRACVLLFKQHKVMATIKMLQGYTYSPIEPYEPEVRKYYRDLQNWQTSIRNLPWMIREFRRVVAN